MLLRFPCGGIVRCNGRLDGVRRTIARPLTLPSPPFTAECPERSTCYHEQQCRALEFVIRSHVESLGFRVCRMSGSRSLTGRDGRNCSPAEVGCVANGSTGAEHQRCTYEHVEERAKPHDLSILPRPSNQ